MMRRGLLFSAVARLPFPSHSLSSLTPLRLWGWEWAAKKRACFVVVVAVAVLCCVVLNYNDYLLRVFQPAAPNFLSMIVTN